jgi:hypothetical protein
MTDPYNLFRQIEHLFRQQEQIRRLSTSTLLQDVAEQFRQQEQIQRLAASSLVHNTVEQFIREQEQLRRLSTSSFVHNTVEQLIREREQLQQLSASSLLQDAAAQFIRQREHLGRLTQDAVVHELLRQSWLVVESAIRLQDFYREITIGDESVSSLEVEEAVQNFFSSIGESYFFETFLERFRNLKDSVKPIAFSILISIIIPYFVNLSSDITYNLIKKDIQPHIDSASPRSSSEVKRSIKNIPNEIDLRNLEGFRIITGDKVRIREQPSTKSRVIRELNRGKIVKTLEKNRNWTLIEVDFNDSDEIIQGWVFTRYTLPIRR